MGLFCRTGVGLILAIMVIVSFETSNSSVSFDTAPPLMVCNLCQNYVICNLQCWLDFFLQVSTIVVGCRLAVLSHSPKKRF